MLGIVQQVGPVANPFAARARLTEFVRSGGTEIELRRILRCAMRSDQGARSPVALAMHWLAEEAMWRAVLEQEITRVRERVLRRRAPSAGMPAAAREFDVLPARRVT